MENASKALIIAGAILLAILIIGLGVFIYNQASNTVSDTGMDQIAVRQFNAQFEPYIMNNASGATAMALYDTVQAYNATATTEKKITLNLMRSEEGIGKKSLKLVKAMAADKPIAKEEGITFNKSELSSVKKYNIRVEGYDGGVIKVINIYPVTNKLIGGPVEEDPGIEVDKER